MRERRVALVLSLLLVALPALADNAKSRDGGGSGGGRSESAGARHHSSGGDSGQRASGGDSRDSGRSSDSGRGSDARASSPRTDAERRHPRAGTGTGYRDGRGRDGRGGIYYGSPYYYGYRSYYPYSDWYGYGLYSGYYGGGYYPYGYGVGYGYASDYRRPYRDAGSLRLLVEPSDTRVYVDGYYAGVVDDFDGLFQRLYLSTGRHELTFKLDGYRSHRIRVYVPLDHTIKVHYGMTRGAGEETSEDWAGYADRDADRRASEEPADVQEQEAREPERIARAGRDDGERGTVRLGVRPDDASVYVDGEFRGAGRQAGRLELTVGRHRIEVVRPGYRTFERDVDVKPGRDVELDVELARF